MGLSFFSFFFKKKIIEFLLSPSSYPIQRGKGPFFLEVEIWDLKTNNEWQMMLYTLSVIWLKLGYLEFSTKKAKKLVWFSIFISLYFYLQKSKTAAGIKRKNKNKIKGTYDD